MPEFHSQQSHSATSAKTVAIIGGGPSGLMAAEVIARAGFKVELFDAMPSVGRKFLLAGVGGMNITHAEAFDDFVTRYAEAMPWLLPYLKTFNADILRDWVQGLGVETFVGSSGRVFPTDMKAAPLLRAWLHRLRELGVVIHPRHRWQGWNTLGELIIENKGASKNTNTAENKNIPPINTFTLKPAATVLALGGASWARLGSDGKWVSLLREHPNLVAQPNVIRDLAPSNCGFLIDWSVVLKEQFSGAPLHTIELEIALPEGGHRRIRGEAIVSEYGLEGSAIYTLSALLRQQLETTQRQQLENTGTAQLTIDLLPDQSHERILELLQKPRGKNSLSNFLRKQLNLSPIKMALLRELTDKNTMADIPKLARAIKYLPVKFYGMRPIDEAISCAGGVTAQALSPKLMLNALPSVFCAGEMLDWEAPTGGYLLTACFATGYAAGLGVVDYLNSLAN